MPSNLWPPCWSPCRIWPIIRWAIRLTSGESSVKMEISVWDQEVALPLPILSLIIPSLPPPLPYPRCLKRTPTPSWLTFLIPKFLTEEIGEKERTHLGSCLKEYRHDEFIEARVCSYRASILSKEEVQARIGIGPTPMTYFLPCNSSVRVSQIPQIAWASENQVFGTGGWVGIAYIQTMNPLQILLSDVLRM